MMLEGDYASRRYLSGCFIIEKKSYAALESRLSGFAEIMLLQKGAQQRLSALSSHS